MGETRSPPAWIRWAIIAGAAMFVLALFVSAVLEPQIRVLHSLQTLIYLAVVALTIRNSAWGYGAGCIVAAFWNYVNLFLTNFVRAGLEQILGWLENGQLERLDLALSLIAAAGHFLLIAGCSAGFLRMRPGTRQWGKFVGGGLLAMAYFVAIIIITGPQYTELLKRIFGL